MAALNESQDGAIRAVIGRLRHEPGPLLEILHGVQDALGHAPPAAMSLIAAELNLSAAEVQGVLSFYPLFRAGPPGRHVVRVCRAEACQSLRGRELERHARARLGIDWRETTADGAFTLEPVYCLGNCACAPAVMIDGDLHGRVTPARFDELLADLDRLR